MTNFLLIGWKPKEKRGVELLRHPAVFLSYASIFAHEKAGTGCRSKLHMHIIMPKRLLRFIVVYPFLWKSDKPDGFSCYEYSPLEPVCQLFLHKKPHFSEFYTNKGKNSQRGCQFPTNMVC